MMDITIDGMHARDWSMVETIYRQGIATGHATFEATVPDWREWDSRHLSACRFIARCGDQVVGWAALSPASNREVYRGVAEVSVYVAASARGQGIGRRLLRTLVEESERAGFWTLQAGIFPENQASIGLHAACGFRTVGRRDRLGQMKGVWRDVILMERRSEVVAT
jgi:phosphinothricin acetyltransferase